MHLNIRSVLLSTAALALAGCVVVSASAGTAIPVKNAVATAEPFAGTSATSADGGKVMDFSPIIYQRMISPERDRLQHTDKYALTCMLYAYYRHWLSVKVTIFSTYKSDVCNPDLFKVTTAASAKAQLIADIDLDYVLMSGPHAQLMDVNNSPLEARFVGVGQLNYAPIAYASVGALDVIHHFRDWQQWISSVSTYSPIRVFSNDDYSWRPGSTIYKLVTDQGQNFVMTQVALTQQMKTGQDVDDALNSLGKYLNLPTGWRYEVQKLDRVMSFKQREFDRDPLLRVLDEFGNIYMEVRKPIK